ncbi:hypothetical protein LOK49_LG15G01816 [Camellia lanceoleosa]|uniref:Uncharacterized protein n=1 Tax=Camellia lanceoleosa TaxID=1840588 RepID=A0ACC0F605_9ERIC|nr:hypothetical protein LOK49_LG15G01816 [Camellia lanceoleosa]
MFESPCAAAYHHQNPPSTAANPSPSKPRTRNTNNLGNIKNEGPGPNTKRSRNDLEECTSNKRKSSFSQTAREGSTVVFDCEFSLLTSSSLFLGIF